MTQKGNKGGIEMTTMTLRDLKKLVKVKSSLEVTRKGKTYWLLRILKNGTPMPLSYSTNAGEFYNYIKAVFL